MTLMRLFVEVRNTDRRHYWDSRSGVESFNFHLRERERAVTQAVPPDDHESDSEPDDERHDDVRGTPDEAPGDGYEALPDSYVARLVHELEQAITASRRTIAIRYAAHGVTLPVPPTLDRAELMVLTALVQIYGVGVFRDDFSAVRQRIAECGAVFVLQQVVFADRPPWGMQRYGAGPRGGSVGGVAARLQEARPLFETLCERFPETFLIQARALLARLARRPLPPEPPLESEDGERDDA